MSAIDDIRKAIQDFLAPELRAIRGEIAIVSERVAGMEKLMDERFQRIEDKINSNHRDVMSALNLEKRMAILEDRQQRNKNEAQ